MTIEGAIVDLQNLINNDLIPFWAKPSLRKIKETVEAEKELRKTGKWIYHIDDLFPAESTQECDQCHEHQPLTCDNNFCPNCGVKMEVDE